MDAFEPLPEQAEAKRLLRAALEDGPAHAYLLHGPPGVGKRAAARAFAAELIGEPDRVLQLNLEATRGLLPDRTFLILVDPAVADARETGTPDRIEAAEGGDFMARVDAGYRELAALFPRRIEALDGAQAATGLAEMILGRVRAAA